MVLSMRPGLRGVEQASCNDSLVKLALWRNKSTIRSKSDSHPLRAFGTIYGQCRAAR